MSHHRYSAPPMQQREMILPSLRPPCPRPHQQGRGSQRPGQLRLPEGPDSASAAKNTLYPAAHTSHTRLRGWARPRSVLAYGMYPTRLHAPASQPR